MASRFIAPFFDAGNGISPSDGAQLFFFETGTSTAKNTFSDQAATTPNTNPVIADSDGLFSDIYIVGDYKVQLKDKNDVQTWETDPVSEVLDTNNGILSAGNIVSLKAADLNIDIYVSTRGYTTAGDGGGADYIIVASGTGTDDGGSFHDLANGNQAQLIFTDVILDQWGCIGDGDGSGSGTDDATQLQVSLNHMRDNGNKLVFSGDKIYRSNSLLTMLVLATTPIFQFEIEGNGSQIDFSGSGLTSGNLLSIGGNALAQIVERGSFVVTNLVIRGPETAAPPTTVTPDTSCVGINIQFALDVHFTEILVRNCFVGFQTKFVFPAQFDICMADACYLGANILGASNDMLWNKFNALTARFGVVIDETANTNKIVGITFVAPRVEGADVGFIIDTGPTSADRVRDIHIYNPYLAGIEFDMIRIGFTFDATAPGTRGVARTSHSSGLVITGGNWVQTAGGWTATHVGIAAAVNTWRNCETLFPSADEANAILNPPLGGLINFLGTVHGNFTTDYKSVYFDNDGNRTATIGRDGLQFNVVTLTDLDTTPDMTQGNIFVTANTGATIITAFDGLTIGKNYTLKFGDNNTTIDVGGVATFFGNQGIDIDGRTNDHVEITFDGTNTYFDYVRSASDSATLTIATGVITVTSDVHAVDTEGGAGSDDLDTINGAPVFKPFVLMANDGTHTVVLKDATGNLKLDGGVDFSLDNLNKTIMLMSKNGTVVELSRSSNNA